MPAKAPHAPIAPPAAVTVTPNLALPPPATTAYGNNRFNHALDDAQSSGLPPLPGVNLVTKVPGIHVMPPASLRNRLHALGKWLNCKNAVFKRDMTDEELLKRGLTRRQMDQAYTELGCP